MCQILNVMLTFAWIQTVLNLNFFFMHRQEMLPLLLVLKSFVGIWNFFSVGNRLENMHLNNVGKYRAFKSVPLSFNYYEDEERLEFQKTVSLLFSNKSPANCLHCLIFLRVHHRNRFDRFCFSVMVNRNNAAVVSWESERHKTVTLRGELNHSWNQEMQDDGNHFFHQNYHMNGVVHDTPLNKTNGKSPDECEIRPFLGE
ncbi:hypothetical protein YC2023_065364 [Brassica napus]